MSMLFAFAILAASPAPQSTVYNDYDQAYRAAERRGKLLLVDFDSNVDYSRIDPPKLAAHVICKLPLDATGSRDNKKSRLLDDPSFSLLENGPGIAVIDLKSEAHLGQVVSALPQRHLTQERAVAILELPAGTLSQRTLVWALRVHPERPQSVNGLAEPALLNHAQNHSQAQASSNTQYHNLPMHIANKEIVAESWPWNQHIVDAAIDIVHSWRQSSGHWSAACGACGFYGYDMKSNGHKWFGTGVFR